MAGYKRPLTVMLAGRLMESAEWSPDGFVVGVSDVTGYASGQVITGYLGPEPDEFLAFAAEVVAIDYAQCRLTLHFIETGVQVFDYLQAIRYRRFLSGKLVKVDPELVD